MKLSIASFYGAIKNLECFKNAISKWNVNSYEIAQEIGSYYVECMTEKRAMECVIEVLEDIDSKFIKVYENHILFLGTKQQNRQVLQDAIYQIND